MARQDQVEVRAMEMASILARDWNALPVDEQMRWCELATAELLMYEALEGVLNYEMQSAKYMGFSDCTCMNRSRAAELSYETGKCPHQIARAALAKAGRT